MIYVEPIGTLGPERLDRLVYIMSYKCKYSVEFPIVFPKPDGCSAVTVKQSVLVSRIYLRIITAAAAVIATVLLIVLLFADSDNPTPGDRSAAAVPKAHYVNRKLIVDHTARTGISSCMRRSMYYTYMRYTSIVYTIMHGYNTGSIW